MVRTCSRASAGSPAPNRSPFNRTQHIGPPGRNRQDLFGPGITGRSLTESFEILHQQITAVGVESEIVESDIPTVIGAFGSGDPKLDLGLVVVCRQIKVGLIPHISLITGYSENLRPGRTTIGGDLNHEIPHSGANVGIHVVEKLNTGVRLPCQIYNRRKKMGKFTFRNRTRSLKEQERSGRISSGVVIGGTRSSTRCISAVGNKIQ